MMRKASLISLVISLAMLLATSCDRLPIGTGPVGAATPASEGPGAGSSAVLSQAVQRLNQADSFKFNIDVNYHWVFEGQEQDWPFKGEGAFAKPEKFYSYMSGPADTEFSFKMIDGQPRCEDTKGVIVQDCSKSFGSIGFGTSPYTSIAYLKNFGQVSDAGVKTLEGSDYYAVSFSPQLSKVAALDSGHAQALQKVTAVEGEVLINKADLSLKQETIRVRFLSPTGSTEAVSTILTFYDYNKPVEIK